ncbi:MAG: hypothetical protein JWM98_1797 [Thermoleophilia bacterium]|nr:hypothetical protein [Thermoleophilia bacterium]
MTARSWRTFCAACDDYVSTDHAGACAWCGGRVRNRTATRQSFGTLRLNDDHVDRIWAAYKSGRSVPSIAEEVWKSAGFPTAATCQRAIYRAFHARKLTTRDQHAPKKHGAFVRTTSGALADPERRRQHFREKLGSRRCAGSNVDGSPCQKWASPASDRCPFHDADRARAAQDARRLAMRAKRPRWGTYRAAVTEWAQEYGHGAYKAAEQACGINRTTLGNLVRYHGDDQQLTPRTAALLAQLVASPPARLERAS